MKNADHTYTNQGGKLLRKGGAAGPRKRLSTLRQRMRRGPAMQPERIFLLPQAIAVNYERVRSRPARTLKDLKRGIRRLSRVPLVLGKPYPIRSPGSVGC